MKHVSSDALQAQSADPMDALEKKLAQILEPVLGDHRSERKALQDRLDGLNAAYEMLAREVANIHDLLRPYAVPKARYAEMQQGPPRVLRLPEVQERTGLKTTRIYELAAKNQFPSPIKLIEGGRAVGWLESEVSEWISSRERGQLTTGLREAQQIAERQ